MKEEIISRLNVVMTNIDVIMAMLKGEFLNTPYEEYTVGKFMESYSDLEDDLSEQLQAIKSEFGSIKLIELK